MANIKLFYDIPAWNMNLNMRGIFRSKYGQVDTNRNGHLDRYDDFVKGYSIWNFAINKSFGKHLETSVGIDNIFNFTDPQTIPNLPGRLAFININLNF